MRKAHQQLLDEIRKRSPAFEPAPETSERIAATEAWLRVPLPDDYDAFLRELGHVSWPMDIGSVLDFKAKDWPTALVPFARDGAVAYGFFLKPRQPVYEDLARETRSRAASIEDEIEGAREDGALTEDLEEHLEGEARAFRLEADEVDERAHERERLKSTDLRIESVSLATLELRDFHHDDEDEPNAFGDWLETEIASAVRNEAGSRTTPEVVLPEPESDEDVALRRALELLDRLVAASQLEVGPDFDDEACARRMAPVYGDAAAILELFIEMRGVEEVFASEDDIESLLAVLALND